MLVVYAILYTLAALCFFAYSLRVSLPHIHLLGLGVFFWALVPLIQTLQKL